MGPFLVYKARHRAGQGEGSFTGSWGSSLGPPPHQSWLRARGGGVLEGQGAGRAWLL